VLALHGWLDNAASFHNLAPLLRNVEIVALDLPGHGHSDHRPAGDAYHFVDYVAVVVEAADALGWDRFSFLGHSLGAGIASMATPMLAGRIEKLALIEGLGPMAAPDDEAPERLMCALNNRRVTRRKSPPCYPNIDAAVQARHAVSDMQPESVKVMVERNLCEIEGGYTWRTDPQLRLGSLLYFTEAQVRAFLQRITIPTLLVCGSHSTTFEREKFLNRCTAVTGIEFVDLPGGHHLHLDHAESVAAAVNAFFSR
jgi:pimeloyl-ACP methyl ester carboxylesterase